MENMLLRRDTMKAAALALLPLAGTARAQAATTLTIWHDLGEPGTKWFAEASGIFAQGHPGVTIRAISYPTDQWFGRVIGALNTDTAPDLIFNNYERVIRIANETGKLMNLKSVLDGIGDRGFLSEDDLRVATYQGSTIILPVQRVQMAFGARTSWLANVHEPFPKTWDDAKRTAEQFQSGDPAGTGKGTVFGFALEAAKPRDLIHMLDLFTFGAGVRHTLLAPDGTITIDEPRHAANRGIVTFIDVHRRRLNVAFGLTWKRAPAHTAIRYVLQGLDPAGVEAAFRRHAALLQAARSTPGQGSIALDGKTLRGSFDGFHDRTARPGAERVRHRHRACARPHRYRREVQRDPGGADAAGRTRRRPRHPRHA